MTLFKVDARAGTVSFKASRAFYSRQSAAIAAHVFESKARVSLAETPRSFELELKARRKGTPAAELEALAGEFLNELLNQEYRLVVGGANKRIADLIVTQALFCAGGAGADGAARAAGIRARESAPEFRAEVDRLMAEARAELALTRTRTPPAKEAASRP
ncbi:MAG TPA: hypothetical protein VN915_03465 [Elusimicrobiota bacterium]|nr:hypothetical protein [Elusimicrobiota bacterium]